MQNFRRSARWATERWERKHVTRWYMDTQWQRVQCKHFNTINFQRF